MSSASTASTERTAAPRASVGSYTPAEPSAPHGVRCANCGSDGCEQFCPRCGQETHDLHRSLAGIFGELLDAFAGWDGKIPVTFWALVRRPGKLTTEFLAGHRARYLRPLRLYLTMSVVFFLSMQFVHNPRARVFKMQMTAAAAGATPKAVDGDSVFKAFARRNAGEQGPGLTPWFKHRVKEGFRAVMQLPPERRAPAVQEAFMSKVGNTIFLLMPLFALVLRVLYRRAPMYVAEHFVFALHVHALAMLAMTLAHLLSSAFPYGGLSALNALPILWMPVYLFVAMRRVYGGTRRRTALKFAALTLTYGPVFIAATTVTALLAIMDLAA